MRMQQKRTRLISRTQQLMGTIPEATSGDHYV